MKLNILVVDDSLIMRKKMKTYLTRMGHNVVGEAINGEEAIAECARLNPDLISMDIIMPEMDGVAAVREIRKSNKEVKILMATSQGQEGMVVHAIQAGAIGYILKPLTLEKLRMSITKIFPEQKRSEECSTGEFDALDDEFLYPAMQY